MNAKEIMKIFEDTAYVRMGGSAEELRAAKYLQEQCAKLCLTATIEEFDVDMAPWKRPNSWPMASASPVRAI